MRNATLSNMLINDWIKNNIFQESTKNYLLMNVHWSDRAQRTVHFAIQHIDRCSMNLKSEKI